MTEQDQDQDWAGVNLIGHSSGAHIAMMTLVERMERKMKEKNDRGEREIDRERRDQAQAHAPAREKTLEFDTFIGMSEVFSISDHYIFETDRGVEEMSPTKAACGYT